MQNEKQELFKVACSLPWNTLRACAWHSVFVGLNQDVSETPFAEEGFECRSAHTFLTTCLKSWKAEQYYWNNDCLLQTCFEIEYSLLQGFWKTGLRHLTAKAGPGASVPGQGSRLSVANPPFSVASNSSQHCPNHQTHTVLWILNGKREESVSSFIPFLLNFSHSFPVRPDLWKHREQFREVQGSISISAESLKVIKINGNRIHICANHVLKEQESAQHLLLPYIIFTLSVLPL